MTALTVGSLFSGAGGLDLGLERAGMAVRWQAEVEPFCCRVLAKHWPGVPNLGDVTMIDWSQVERVDLICGGFPCQPVSQVGLKRAQDDERWLWPEMRSAIERLRPGWVLIENVSGLRVRGLDVVRRDLDAMDYRSRPVPLAACELGAPHTRARLFILAHAPGVRCGQRRHEAGDAGEAESQERQAWVPPGRGSWWAAGAGVRRVAYGVPRGVDRRRALGNAVVPQMAEWIGWRIMESAA